MHASFPRPEGNLFFRRRDACKTRERVAGGEGGKGGGGVRTAVTPKDLCALLSRAPRRLGQ